LADQVQQGAGAGARHAANLRAAHRCARLPSVLLQGHGRRCSTHPDPMHMQRRALATAGVQTFQVCWRGLRRPQVGDGRLPSAQQEHQKALQNGLTGAYPMPLGEARHVPCPRACVMNERGERCASNSGLPFCEWWVRHRQAACVRKAPSHGPHGRDVDFVIACAGQAELVRHDSAEGGGSMVRGVRTAPESQCTVGGEVW